MIFSIALGALSVFKGIQEYQAQRQQSKIAKKNAEIAERNAQYASEIAVNNAEIEKQKNRMEKEAQYEHKRRERAIQEASYATSGILLDGTPSQYLQAQVETDEINLDRQDQASYARQMNIIYQGQVERAHLQGQAESFSAQADAYKSSASTSLLGGAVKGGAMIGAGILGASIDGDDSFPWMKGGNDINLDSLYSPLSLSDANLDIGSISSSISGPLKLGE